MNGRPTWSKHFQLIQCLVIMYVWQQRGNFVIVLIHQFWSWFVVIDIIIHWLVRWCCGRCLVRRGRSRHFQEILSAQLPQCGFSNSFITLGFGVTQLIRFQCLALWFVLVSFVQISRTQESCIEQPIAFGWKKQFSHRLGSTHRKLKAHSKCVLTQTSVLSMLESKET